MSVPRRRILLASVALAAVPATVLVAGCGSSDSASSSTAAATTATAPANSISIAVEAPLSGDQAASGQDMLNGVKLAADEVNAKGGVLGKQINIIPVDDKADPAVGKTVAQQTVDQGLAVAVVGPYNSGVGIENLSIYKAGGLAIARMTSDDKTSGFGVTTQPMNSQISPVEIDYISGLKPAKVSMLVDPSAYTQSMAARLKAGLTKMGINVSSVEIKAGEKDYAKQVSTALTDNPEVVYVSTYYPEGAIIAKDLAAEAAKGNTTSCFMGLANQDPGFITAAGVANSEKCVFSGVPSPDAFPGAASYVTDYTAKFGNAPGTWGTFTYDSANIVFAAITKAGSADSAAIAKQLAATSGFKGITGTITVEPGTGNREDPPVKILKVTGPTTFTVVS
jgi:branched-chain amino acid transport system substrate-binding protein